MQPINPTHLVINIGEVTDVANIVLQILKVSA